MRAIILAAGIGERLRPITDRIPKCLIPIGHKTLLNTQINILNECGINDDLEKRVILDLISNEVETVFATITAKSVEYIGNRVKYDDEGYVLDIGRKINLAFPWEIFSGIMKVSGNLFNRFRKEANKNIYKNEEWT